MTKRKQIHPRNDTTVLEFEAKIYRDRKLSTLTRTKSFPSYGDAMVYLTDRKLGLIDEDTYSAWMPKRLVRRVHRPGKGLVTMTLALDTEDG